MNANAINLNDLSASELRILNARIIDRLNALNIIKAGEFQVGDRVTVKGKKIQDSGTVEQIKLKNVVVRLDSDGKRWVISASLLTKVEGLTPGTPKFEQAAAAAHAANAALTPGQKAALTRRLRQAAASAAA